MLDIYAHRAYVYTFMLVLKYAKVHTYGHVNQSKRASKCLSKLYVRMYVPMHTNYNTCNKNTCRSSALWYQSFVHTHLHVHIKWGTCVYCVYKLLYIIDLLVLKILLRNYSNIPTLIWVTFLFLCHLNIWCFRRSTITINMVCT